MPLDVISQQYIVHRPSSLSGAVTMRQASSLEINSPRVPPFPLLQLTSISLPPQATSITMSQYLQFGAAGMNAPGLRQHHLSTLNQPLFQHSSALPLSRSSSGSVLDMASASQPRASQAYMPHPSRPLSESSPLLAQQAMPPLRPTVEISDIRNECLTEADARKKLSTYVAVHLAKSLQHHLDFLGNLEKPTWELAERMVITDMSQHEIKRKLRQLKGESDDSVADKKSILDSRIRIQVDRAREILQTRELDNRFEYTLCQLEPISKKVGSSSNHRASGRKRGGDKKPKEKSKSKAQKTRYPSIIAYYKRAPTEKESSKRMLEEELYTRQRRWSMQPEIGPASAPSYYPSLSPAQQYPQNHFQATFYPSAHSSPEPSSQFASQYPTFPPPNNSQPAMPPSVHLQGSYISPVGAGVKNALGVDGKNNFEHRRNSFLSTTSGSSSSSDDATDTTTSESSEDSDPHYYSTARLSGTNAYRKNGGIPMSSVDTAARSSNKRSQKDKIKSSPARHNLRSPVTSSPTASALDAREVLHALADVIRVEDTKKHQEAIPPSLRSSSQRVFGNQTIRSQSSKELASTYGQVGGEEHRSQMEGEFYRPPELTRGETTQYGYGRPSWLFRGYPEDRDWEPESSRRTWRQHGDQEYARRMRAERGLYTDNPFRPADRQRDIDYYKR